MATETASMALPAPVTTQRDIHMRAKKQRSTARASAMLLITVLLTACAQIPKSTVAESQFATLSCDALAQQTEEATKTKAIADEARSDSWHAVVPVIVAVRYRQAAAASTDAQKRLTLLAEQANRRGCAG
ncbi:hypothetical protein GGR70_003032 [Xanthomonas campestris]|uniref:hypothetical protein n=1 Tax=Xanthomonas campestris TaxID=339 RepID=UPI00216A1EA1|nr:hypothetical protein [Xanthomonas campestris]MCS3847999.1 hypothetical protein [Xanthomonas campestris]